MGNLASWIRGLKSEGGEGGLENEQVRYRTGIAAAGMGTMSAEKGGGEGAAFHFIVPENIRVQSRPGRRRAETGE